MSDSVDVAIIGAGPYGLSLAAHLRAAGMPFRLLGMPMGFWRTHMPAGMILKSQGFASNLSSPDADHTLEAFCLAADRPYAWSGLPVQLDTFLAYGLWFQQRLIPDLEQTHVTSLTRTGDEYRLVLADGGLALARRVVVATGVERFAVIPEPLAALPDAACTHSSVHCDLAEFAGRSVVVIGAGQSALETAALLHEQGASVQLVARTSAIVWNAPALPQDRPLAQRLVKPQAGVGPGWRSWFISEQPGLWRRLPESMRVHRVKTALGPAGASWLRERVDGKFPVLLGQALTWTKMDGDAVRLGFDGPTGQRTELVADHVIAATGYRTDLRGLDFLDGGLRAGIRAVADAPILDRHFQTSVPGLHFIGSAAAITFGPVMRFVYGADYAARTVAGHLVRTASHPC